MVYLLLAPSETFEEPDGPIAAWPSLGIVHIHMIILLGLGGWMDYLWVGAVRSGKWVSLRGRIYDRNKIRLTTTTTLVGCFIRD